MWLGLRRARFWLLAAINSNILCALKDLEDALSMALVVNEVVAGKDGVDDGEKFDEVECMVRAPCRSCALRSYGPYRATVLLWPCACVHPFSLWSKDLNGEIGIGNC